MYRESKESRPAKNNLEKENKFTQHYFKTYYNKAIVIKTVWYG